MTPQAKVTLQAKVTHRAKVTPRAKVTLRAKFCDPFPKISSVKIKLFMANKISMLPVKARLSI